MPIIMKNRKCTISEYDRRFQAALSLWLPVILIYAAYVWQKEEIHMSIKKIRLQMFRTGPPGKRLVYCHGDELCPK